MAKPSPLAVFSEICDLPPEAQQAALAELCDRDEALMDTVRRMLARDAAPETLLDQAGDAVLAALLWDDREPVPAEIGPYRVIGVLGRGGMGVVYEAEQRQPRRSVAIKVRPCATAPGRRCSRPRSRRSAPCSTPRSPRSTRRARRAAGRTW
jgi:hypothetical protein